MPSEVRLTQGRPSGFGWSAGETQDVVSSVKTQLLEGSQRAKLCVSYLLEKIFDRVAEVKGSHLLSNAQIVMSLPVLDDGERAEKQQAITLECALEAGIKYGLSAEQLVTYSEPECALVDILHAMKKSQEAGGPGEIPMPSDGDWLCVVDIGGGTTDVSLTQFALVESGRPELRHLKVAGFSRAGDFIDQELYVHCLQCWSDAQRLIGERPAAFTPTMLEEPLKLKGETAYHPQSRVFQEVRRAKEYMYDHSPSRPYTLESFGIKRNHLPLSPEPLDNKVFLPALKVLFEGSPEADEPSFQQCLASWKVPVDQIRFLFLTGGTSCLPSVLEVLKSDHLRSPSLKSLPNLEPRKNVVRGAALRPSLRLPNMLPFEVVLRFGQSSNVLRQGTVPGASIEQACQFVRGARHSLQVLCRIGEQNISLASFPLALATDNKEPTLMAKAFLHYTVDCRLELEARWLKDDVPEFLATMEIASIPREGSR